MKIHFDQHLLSLNNSFFSPEEAIRYAGTLLLQTQACNEQYIDEMIAVYHEFGSIIVLDNGVAMPHARPEKGALKTAFSVVIVKEPLIFHHEEFDPVHVIIAIAASDSDNHIYLIQVIADLIERNIVDFIKNNTDKNTILQFIHHSLAEAL
ncbi:PTS sugar transporter subunit IIA [Klebsiella sp. BIGb0407]|uniref:PTS sugar transporter subunit IIA n=1 Tax=Klebsiella sp. BIGb0407 TaxID=2940603 RepID=UPI0021687BCA|nr:PTS sugar transporter subunit IIA [Klebsiella sp. BIGb0407]